MRVLGLRAEPTLVNWAVVEGEPNLPILVAVGTAESPSSYAEPEALAWFRTQANELIEQFSPGRVAVRFPEAFVPGRARDSARRRCRVEGVIIEAATSRGVPVRTGALATISKGLQTASPRAKAYLASNNFRGLDWSNYGRNVREAILAAASVLGG